MKHTKKILAMSALLAAAGAALAHSPAPSQGPSPGAGEPTIAEVRSATKRFADVETALAAGYIRDPGNLCETASVMCANPVHNRHAHRG